MYSIFVRHFYTAVLLCSFVLLSSPLSADEYEDRFKPGTKISGHLALNSHSPIIALPPGIWEVAGFKTTTNNIDTLFASGFLFQREGQKFLKGVYFIVPTNHADGYLPAKYCERTNMHFIRKISNDSGGDQDCYYVNHYRVTLSGSKNQFVNKIGEYLINEEIEVPNHLVQSGHRKADSSMMLTVRYYFNPLIDGFDDFPRTTWADSPWHPSAIIGDEKKQKYIHKIIDWTKRWHPVFIDGFKEKLTAGGTVNVSGNRPPASPKIEGSAEDRLISLRRLLDRDLITRDEYNTRRKEILDSL
jgi:hypothetical protein